MTDLPPPQLPLRDRVTVADTYQEQRVTPPSHLDYGSLTVTLVSGDNLVNSTAVAPRVQARFRRLVDLWRDETFFSSSVTNNLYHPAYLKIMAMGERVLPLILRELEDRGGQWFMALRHIVDEREYPDKPNDIGKPKELKEAWLEWGRQNNYL